MQVFDLKNGDYVTIGEDIKVYFEHKIGRDSIKIEAPKHLKILRAKHFESAIKRVGEDNKCLG